NDKLCHISKISNLLILDTVMALQSIKNQGFLELYSVNLFIDLLRRDSNDIFAQIEMGQQEVELDLTRGDIIFEARIQWLPEPDWFVVQFQQKTEQTAPDATPTQLTVQELLQEREITYRNLLAAYLRLQEVNRQKTVLLGSAAHEL